MASIVQKNGIKPLVNGATGIIQLVDVDNVCASRQHLHLQQQQQQFQHLQQHQLLQQQLHQNIQHEQPVMGQALVKVEKTETLEDGENGEHSESVENGFGGSISAELDQCLNSAGGSINLEPGQCLNSASGESASVGSASGGSEEPVIDIVISNVVCSFSVRCHLNLRQIGLNGSNVEYRRESGMVSMKLRKPYTTASIWSSGNITCTGATSEASAKVAARRFARSLQKMGFRTRFHNFRVVNVLGTCSMPFAIKIPSFVERHKEADYEPELHPGVTYKLKNPKATLKIFSTGSVTVTGKFYHSRGAPTCGIVVSRLVFKAPSVSSVQKAIEYIFPLVYEFRKEKSAEDEISLRRRLKSRGSKRSALTDGDDGDVGVFKEEEEDEEDEEEDEMIVGAGWD